MLCLFLTNKCSFECPHCLANSSPNRNKFMPEEVFFEILNTFENHDFNLCGGEPTLHPQFPMFLREAVSHANEYTRVVTNAEWFILGEQHEFYKGDRPDRDDFEDYDEYEEAETEWYDSLSEEDSNIGIHCDFDATTRTVEFCRAVFDAMAWQQYARLEIHVSDDQYHNYHISSHMIKNAIFLLQSIFDGDNVDISTDHEFTKNRRYVLPIGRGSEVTDFTDERGPSCVGPIKQKDHSFFKTGRMDDSIQDDFNDKLRGLNVFYDGQISPCEGGRYMFANVMEHTYEEIERRYFVVYQYMQQVFARGIEAGERGADQCITCQQNFPYFKKHILPKLDKLSKEEIDADGVRKALGETNP